MAEERESVALSLLARQACRQTLVAHTGPSPCHLNILSDLLPPSLAIERDAVYHSPARATAKREEFGLG